MRILVSIAYDRLICCGLLIGRRRRPMSFVWPRMRLGLVSRLWVGAMAGHINGLGEPFPRAFYLVTNLPVDGSLPGWGFGFSPSSAGVLLEDCCSCCESSHVSHSLCSSEKGASERSRFFAITLASSMSLRCPRTVSDAEKSKVAHRERPNSHLH